MNFFTDGLFYVVESDKISETTSTAFLDKMSDSTFVMVSGDKKYLFSEGSMTPEKVEEMNGKADYFWPSRNDSLLKARDTIP